MTFVWIINTISQKEQVTKHIQTNPERLLTCFIYPLLSAEQWYHYPAKKSRFYFPGMTNAYFSIVVFSRK